MSAPLSTPSKQWVLAQRLPAAATLAQELEISPLVAHLLCQRGVTETEAAAHFLEPKLASLGDPLAFIDMRAAATRLLTALHQQQRITIFGDYDVDGITSTALLTRALRVLDGRVETFLPRRMSEGYGLTITSLDRCLRETQPQLLIALDCGTTAVHEIAWLRERGIDTVVIDHHELPPALPACDALVNPHRDGHSCYLCSVGLTFKLCHALLKIAPELRTHLDLKQFLDLVAVGTVADIVPLVHDNRIFVRTGLQLLERTRNPGLRALLDLAGIRHPPRPEDVGFRIGPRLNASGRLDDATDSLRLLLTDDAAEAHRLAQHLDALNRDRQALEQRIFDEALELLERQFDLDRDAAIVLGQRGWHAGVIGIVAARFQRMFHRPAIIIAFDKEGQGKGSGRSIEGCSLIEGLKAAASHLEKFGGHEMAAGLSLREEQLSEFSRAFHDYAHHVLDPAQLRPRLQLAATLQVDDLNEELFFDLDRLAPFGRDNPQPLFALHRVGLARPPQPIKRHIKLFLQGSRCTCEAMGFGFADRPLPKDPLSIAGALEWNDYSDTVQFRLVDWQASAVADIE